MNKAQLVESLRKDQFPNYILKAFEKVRREDFIPRDMKEYAYDDEPLSIGKWQTISQPFTIAMMLNMLELRKKHKVLEVGSGCGYVLALMSEIVGPKGHVYGIERIKGLANKSRVHLRDYKNIQVYNYDGSKGLEKKAKFDRIIISAACEEVPKTLLSQLKNNGVLVAPVGSQYTDQSLVTIKRVKDTYITKREMPGFTFVPFVKD